MPAFSVGATTAPSWPAAARDAQLKHTACCSSRQGCWSAQQHWVAAPSVRVTCPSLKRPLQTPGPARLTLSQAVTATSTVARSVPGKGDARVGTTNSRKAGRGRGGSCVLQLVMAERHANTHSRAAEGQKARAGHIALAHLARSDTLMGGTAVESAKQGHDAAERKTGTSEDAKQ